MAHSFKLTILFFLLLSLLIDIFLCNIVKRKAPDGKLYVFSKREGCVSVQSASPCRLNWKLNPYIAKIYAQQNAIVSHAVNLYGLLGISFRCTNAVKEALCSQLTPKCSEKDYSRDYGDVTRLCNNIYSSCPSTVVNNLKKNNFCRNLKKGRRSNGQCVTNTAAVAGACPQPTYKMTPEFFEDYQKASVKVQTSLTTIRNARYSDGRRIFSDICASQMTEIQCVPLYCSANETELLVKFDKDDCNKLVHTCFDEPFRKLSQSSSIRRVLNTWKNQFRLSCNKYPASSSDLRPEPPRIGEKTPTTTGHTPKQRENLPTANRNRKKVGKNTPKGSGNTVYGSNGILSLIFFALLNELLIA
ncbi:uncharacterized protein LOC124440139 [Xenia sp. Carnegie-2017]|uniref:uncharacterized protein LOC124440139 n=1 Tax=Xenia sp. Carnegie-2017 TaxID=2897299 RepID=UPI001F04C77E|nr:uncharacterized protein LOC124440139 [Xenia sp. Carnegie-2017]